MTNVDLVYACCRTSLRVRSLPTPTCVFAHATPSPGVLIRACLRSTSTCTPCSESVQQRQRQHVSLCSCCCEAVLAISAGNGAAAGARSTPAAHCWSAANDSMLWHLQLLSLRTWPELTVPADRSSICGATSCTQHIADAGVQTAADAGAVCL